MTTSFARTQEGRKGYVTQLWYRLAYGVEVKCRAPGILPYTNIYSSVIAELISLIIFLISIIGGMKPYLLLPNSIVKLHTLLSFLCFMCPWEMPGYKYYEMLRPKCRLTLQDGDKICILFIVRRAHNTLRGSLSNVINVSHPKSTSEKICFRWHKVQIQLNFQLHPDWDSIEFSFNHMLSECKKEYHNCLNNNGRSSSTPEQNKKVSLLLCYCVRLFLKRIN